MDFSNAQVATDDLPDYSRVDFTALPVRFLRLRMTVLFSIYLLLALLLSVAVFLSMTFDPSPLTAFFTTPQGMVLIIATPLLMILLAWFVIASTQAIGYAVRDHDVIVRSGVFWKKQVIQPLRRVQHVEVTNGPLDKRYGLANVILFSAGTNLSTFRLPGLEQADAERIRQFVLDYQLVARGANPSAPESTTA